MTGVEEALAAAAAAGPFYVLETHIPPPGGGGGPPWWPFADLVATDRQLLRARISAVCGVLGERANVPPERIDAKAAASLVHLGMSARLVSPPLAAAVLGGVALHLAVDRLHWRDVLGPVPLTQPNLTVTPISDDAVAIAESTREALAHGPVAVLTEAVAALGVSRRVLWGNVASSFVAAASGLVRFAPDRAGVLARVVDQLFAAPPLQDQGTFAPAFKRTGCCLYYRVPGGGYCGDCVLA
ncbi:MAG: (2Fe-2S)-binding protein [Sporichthyaceae bacterium]